MLEAADRKDAWIRLEDEFWEVETRWKWILTKTKEKCFPASTSPGNPKTKEKETSPKESKEVKNLSVTKRPQGENKTQESEFESVPKMLSQFCQNMCTALRRTTSTMNEIKGLMWHNWENETICESFYDAIQYSQQLLENLSVTWTIAFSLFRAREMELLYKAERLATHSALAHQLALKFIMNCWQTYIAAYCHCWVKELNQARVKVKQSSHAIGRLFAASLESSHALITSISRQLSHTMNPEPMHSHETKTSLAWDCQESFSRKNETNLELKEKVSEYSLSSLEKGTNRPAVSVHSGMDISKGLSESDERTSSNNVEEKSLPPKKRRCDKSHWPLIHCPNERHCSAKKKTFKALDNLRANRYRPLASPRCNVQLCLPKMSSYNSPKPFPKDQKREKRKPPGPLDARKSPSQCKCYCESPDMDSETEGTEENDNFHTKFLSAMTSTSPKAEIPTREWETLIEDVKDLQTEWDSLSLQFCLNLFRDDSANDSVFKSIQSQAISEMSLDGSQEETEESEQSLDVILKGLVSAIAVALKLSSVELKKQMEVWSEKKGGNEFESHCRGFDPSEALLQAKSLLFQLTQSFFSVLLLTTSDNRRRALCYASLLPESLAESRRFAYNLVLARVNPTGRHLSEERSSVKSTSYPSSPHKLTLITEKRVSANPHPLCQYLALALCKAHQFSGQFTAFFPDENESTEAKVEFD